MVDGKYPYCWLVVESYSVDKVDFVKNGGGRVLRMNIVSTIPAPSLHRAVLYRHDATHNSRTISISLDAVAKHGLFCFGWWICDAATFEATPVKLFSKYSNRNLSENPTSKIQV